MDADLSDLLTTRCSPYVTRVEADFVRKKDFYYAWSVRGGTAVVHLSDYLRDAPGTVLADFGEMMVRRATGLDWDTPRSFLEYVGTDGFITSNRPVFIQRSRNLLRTDIGEHAFIPDSVQRLLDLGLLQPSDIGNSWFSWTRRENVRRLGFCSTLFRVVGISAILDDPGIDDSVRDYVVYHECLHLRQGYRPENRTHDRQFRTWERAFPSWEDCERELRRLGA